jgi:hypothetical protein
MADDPGSRSAGKTFDLDEALIDFMRDPTTPALTPDELRCIKSSVVLGRPPTKTAVELLVKLLRGEDVPAKVLDLRGWIAKKRG